MLSTLALLYAFPESGGGINLGSIARPTVAGELKSSFINVTLLGLKPRVQPGLFVKSRVSIGKKGYCEQGVA